MDDIMEIIKTYSGEDIDLCYYVFQSMKTKDDPAIELMEFFENVGLQESTGSVELMKRIDDEELTKMDSLYSEYINMFLKTLVGKAHLESWEKSKFYKYLWNNLNMDLIFEDDKVRSFALLRWAQSDLLPYIEIESPISMSNDEFSEILSANRNVVNRIKHIVALNYSQKTEVASLILNEIMPVESKKEQAVVFAVALDAVIRRRLKKMTTLLEEITTESKQKK